MADGTPMKPSGDNAASKTLPLGTVAKVTNLENGQSTEVTIQDRGPYVPGRIIDLSPSTAREIGITHKKGVAPVEVAPIVVPTPDGGVKPGDGAGRRHADSSARTVALNAFDAGQDLAKFCRLSCSRRDRRSHNEADSTQEVSP